MRRALLAVWVLAIVLVVVPLAHAITNGEPDGTAHPYVGLVGFYDADGTYVQRCSGSLIAPTVVLTAAHCAFADDGTQLVEARAWFDPVVDPGVVSGKVEGTGGTAVPHPDFDAYASFPESNDVAVVRLTAPVSGVGLASLPPVGVLDTLTKKTASFTLVGYGLLQVKPVEVTGDRTRLRADAVLGGQHGSKTAGFNLRTKPGKDGGGFCFGDSGGPALLGDTDVVVGVSSLVQQNCTSYALSYRIDTVAVRGWLAAFLPSSGSSPAGA
ncbi:MAG: S1 family peptidase [Gaiella sp.]